jgi:hypothetical protein
MICNLDRKSHRPKWSGLFPHKGRENKHDQTTDRPKIRYNAICDFWEFIIEHVQYIKFGTRESFTYVIFGIDINPYPAKVENMMSS